MRLHRLVPVLLVALVSFVLMVQPSCAADKGAKPPALTGMVTGPDGKALEGVIVTAGRQTSTITVSVISQADGTMRSRPASWLRTAISSASVAVGYELAVRRW